MSNNHLSLAPCCQQLFHEKEMFKRALHREREKRRFVELAYKDLLKIHQNLIELRSTLDVSSSSLIISSTANEHQPEQQNTQNFEIASSPITLLTKPSKNFLKQRVQFNEQSAKHLPSSPSFGKNKDSANEVFQSNSQVPVTNQSMVVKVINKHGNGARRRKMADLVSKSKIIPFNEKDNNLTTEKEHQRFFQKSIELCNIHRKQHALAFFIPLSENFVQNFEKAKILRERSAQRCNAIQEASRKRALIASNRRAIACDILTGKRLLDEEAKKILRKNSTCISAFPKLMKQMKEASKRFFF